MPGKRGRGTRYGSRIGKRFKHPRRTHVYPMRGRGYRAFKPGKDRVSGYYGRFAGPSGERKFKDTGFASVINDTTLIQQLTVIPEGNGESERIGRKITLRNIHVKGQLVLSPETLFTTKMSDWVEIYILQDTQTNGALFTGTDLLENDNIEAFRNLANSSRFKVLKKKTFSMNALVGIQTSEGPVTFATGEVTRAFSMNIQCDIPIEYDNSLTTGVITTVRSNNIYLCAISVEGKCVYGGTVRLRYSDK